MNTSASSFRRILEGQVLTWIGIVGATITLVGNLGTLVTLANWCQWLVDNYKHFTESVAAYVSQLLSLKITGPEIAYGLYFLFLVSLAAGARSMSSDMHSPARFRFICSAILLILILGICRAEAAIFGAWELGNTYHTFFGIILLCALALNFPQIRSAKDCLLITGLSVLLYLAHWLMNTGKLFNIFTLWGLSDITLIELFKGQGPRDLFVTSFVLLIVPIIPHLIAPYRPLLRRCSFVALGIAIVLGLSEVSRFITGWSS